MTSEWCLRTWPAVATRFTFLLIFFIGCHSPPINDILSKSLRGGGSLMKKEEKSVTGISLFFSPAISLFYCGWWVKSDREAEFLSISSINFLFLWLATIQRDKRLTVASLEKENWSATRWNLCFSTSHDAKRMEITSVTISISWHYMRCERIPPHFFLIFCIFFFTGPIFHKFLFFIFYCVERLDQKKKKKIKEMRAVSYIMNEMGKEITSQTISPISIHYYVGVTLFS